MEVTPLLLFFADTLAGLFVDMDVITPREQILPGREYDAGMALLHQKLPTFLVQARS